ncbi:MAG: DUF503 domain-containing protein [Aeromicrobium sp.]|uniref:DUF503 domain-containing protein n=1 Tax=Aeromicrobium sp. TaxID=1871063 RepID=UPI0039E501C4
MSAMWIGWLSMDLRLGDVHSLKQKRSVVRPIVAELARKLSVSAAETGHLDLYRRAEVGVGVVASTQAHATEVLEAAERLVAERPEVELVEARPRVLRADDLD